MDGGQFEPARELRQLGPVHWYRRPGKSAALVISVDDVFPGTPHNPYEAGGALEKGALGRLLWLLERHPQLQLTLFVTPDWRQISPVAHRVWRQVPWLRDRLYLASVLPKGTMDLRYHPEFVDFLNAMPRTEIAIHGLHHIRRGGSVFVEFKDQDRAACAGMLAEAMRIFDECGLHYQPGLQPPGWDCSPALQHACQDVGIEWVSSARDIHTPVSRDAKAAMSGLHGVSMLFPESQQFSGNIAGRACIRHPQRGRDTVDQGTHHKECPRAHAPGRR